VRAQLGALAAAAICAGFAALHAGALADGVWAVDQRATQRKSLDAVVASAGGAAALRACGTVRTAAATRGLVAWRLGVALRDIDEAPVRPGVLLRSRPRDGAPLEPPAPRGFVGAARSSRWEIRTACGG
jgi:aspartate oxidase